MCDGQQGAPLLFKSPDANFLCQRKSGLNRPSRAHGSGRAAVSMDLLKVGMADEMQQVKDLVIKLRASNEGLRREQAAGEDCEDSSQSAEAVQLPSLSPGLTPHIKEEHNIKQEEDELQVSIPEFTAVSVKTEESLPLQQRQTEQREDTQEEDIKAEIHVHFEDTQGEDVKAELHVHFEDRTETHVHSESEEDTEHSSDSDEDWRAPLNCSPAHMDTGADGDHHNQVQLGARSTTAQNSCLSPKYKLTPEIRAIVNNGDKSRTGKGAESWTHKCPVCKESFGSIYKLDIHRRVHTGGEPFSCSVCKKTFARKGHLENHMKTHTGEKPFSCSVCKKMFGLKDNLKTHMRTHTGEKPFSCSVCKKTFARNDRLEDHMKTHTGEKPFSCSVCKKVFAFRTNIKRHMKIHTGEKPFSCSVCKHTFALKDNLKIHMRTHAEEKPFSCSVCKKTFARKGQLEDHMRRHTGKKPFSCPDCEKVFATKRTLKKHMKTHQRLHI